MYKKEIKLNDCEIPAKINLETGEITEIREIFRVLPENKDVWLKEEKFTKMFTYSWRFLVKELSAEELKVLIVMTTMAHAGTNALPPLNDELSMVSLEDVFLISRKRLPKILKRLFDLGVYAKFEVAKIDEPFKKYWILNPYVSFKGRLIDHSIIELFFDTRVELEYSRQFKKDRESKIIPVEKREGNLN